jgi:hypothetical protein
MQVPTIEKKTKSAPKKGNEVDNKEGIQEEKEQRCDNQ